MWQIRKPKEQVRPKPKAETAEERRLVTTGDAGAFANRERAHRPQGRASPAAARPHQPVGARQHVARADRGGGRRHRPRGAATSSAMRSTMPKRKAGRRRARRAARPRAARAAAQGRDDHRHFGQRPHTGVRRALRRARADARCGSRTRSTCSGSSRRSCRRSAAASMNPRRWSMPAWPTAAASTRSFRRWRSTARLLSIRKFAKVPISMDRLIEIGSVPAQVAEVLKAVVAARLQRADLGRHRLGQDDHAQRHVGVHRQSRADRDDRGFGRASAAAGACRPAGNAPAEYRGQGRDRASATWSRTRCACGPTGSSSARFAPARRSTCSRR